jgi:LacI family transcriptional regulator, repressor for deo operon, udp, cdd, tsx, nupC, and nupG
MAEANRKRPTIDDVARRAGVSSAAVSFAMNGRPGVGEATRRRILDAAEDLGWSPSAPARALSESRTRAIGLLLARPVEALEIDPFFVRFLAGVERALARSDHALMLRVIDGEGPVDVDAYAQMGTRVDGLLLCDVELDDPRFGPLAERGLPVVVAGRPASACPFPWIETRHALGAAAATEHLIALGHRRIGFLGGFERLEHVQARLAAWRGALDAAGLEPGPVAFADPEAALGGDPTALVCTSDVLAVAVLRRAAISVTGFDDSPLAAFSSPPLTSVRVDYAQFGEAAADALLAVIGGAPPPPFDGATPQLHVRGSTGPPPG